MKPVLIIGSAPNSLESRDWDKSQFSAIVAINNAWRVRPDWDYLIHPDDFPADRMPENLTAEQRIVTSAGYVPAQNELGGFVYAGGTMAFTAGYWALLTLKPDVLAFIGCDMVYPSFGNTHFYGKGDADPLRSDITLQSLEAKSARLAVKAAQRGCACVNLSRNSSRLLFPRSKVADLRTASGLAVDRAAVSAAEAQEARLNYFEASGRYWRVRQRFDANKLAVLDGQWLQAVRAG